jgi:ADP-ribose pyrophosphatase YjhB (NUDIX family)
MQGVRFCSSCGSELRGPPPITCAACGTGHWLNPKPCANAIVVAAGSVLLARRAYAPWKDLWGSPGGFCEPGEHPIETAEREVLEETGTAVSVTGYLGVWVDRYADDPDDRDAAVINVAYYLAEPNGDGTGAADPGEVSELRWFAWDELPADLAPPGTLRAVLDIARDASATPPLDRP